MVTNNGIRHVIRCGDCGNNALENGNGGGFWPSKRREDQGLEFEDTGSSELLKLLPLECSVRSKKVPTIATEFEVGG